MDNQTISQTLRRVAKLKGKMAELQARAAGAVTHKYGDDPAFSFTDTMVELDATRRELMNLQVAVAITNARTFTNYINPVNPANSFTLTGAIAYLQELKGQITWLRTLAVRAQKSTQEETREFDDETTRYKKITVQWLCDLPEAERAKRIDALQNEFDSLNDAVERINHSTQLVP
jgi:hypothetical protein